jgi:Rrf2 family iron-sulfur cluster assembly transcriptional regulator
MLSNTCKYAIRSVIYLALNSVDGEKIGIKKISEDLSIPSPFLGKIMQVLAKNKMLASTKGPNGGFSLGKPAKNITLMVIVDIIDGEDNFNSCVIGLQSCTKEEANCPIHSTYAPIREEAKQLFIKLNIHELADHIRKNKNTIVI